MNTDRLTKLAFPYLIILLLDALWGYFLYYGRGILQLVMGSDDSPSLPMLLTTNFTLIFQVMIAVLLFIDLRRHNIKYYLIPFCGFIFPLLGITMFLIVLINKDSKSDQQPNDAQDQRFLE